MKPIIVRVSHFAPVTHHHVTRIFLSLLIFLFVIAVGACGDSTVSTSSTLQSSLTPSTQDVNATATAFVTTTSATVTTLSASSTTSAATSATATAVATGNFHVTFTQQFSAFQCPQALSVAARCLYVTAQGHAKTPGTLIITRVAFLVTNDTSDCSLAYTAGTLSTDTQDSMTISAKGTYCNGTALYIFTVTGGIGKFSKAAGQGTITVPPGSNGAGTETWDGTIETGA